MTVVDIVIFRIQKDILRLEVFYLLEKLKLFLYFSVIVSPTMPAVYCR